MIAGENELEGNPEPQGTAAASIAARKAVEAPQELSRLEPEGNPEPQGTEAAPIATRKAVEVPQELSRLELEAIRQKLRSKFHTS